MVDFDLIPVEYKYWLWQRVCLKRFIVILVLCLVALICLVSYWNYQKNKIHTNTSDLEHQSAIGKIQGQQLDELIKRKSSLQAQWTLLNALRGGTTVESIIATIDKTLIQDDIWFLDWQFSRDEQKISSQNITTQTGHFINIPNTVEASSVSEVLQIFTEVRISGQAKDHSAFSGFVQRLIVSDDVLDVKIIKTTLNKLNNVNIIDFDILVMIKNNWKNDMEANHA